MLTSSRAESELGVNCLRIFTRFFLHKYMKQQGRTPARLPYISSLPHTHELQSSCPSKKPFYMRGFICAHASRVGTRPRQSQSGLRKGPVYSCRTGQETPRTWDLGGGPGVSVAGGPGVSVARGSSGPGVYLKARAPEAEPKSTLRVAEAHWRVTVTESAGKEVCSVLVRIRVCPQGFVMVIGFPRTTTHVPRAGEDAGLFHVFGFGSSRSDLR